MSKNIEKLEKVEEENIETKEEITEESETIEVSKPKWSLKKKLLIGGGILAGLALGAIALISKKSVETTDEQEEDSEDDDNVTDTDAPESEEIPEKVEEQSN